MNSQDLELEKNITTVVETSKQQSSDGTIVRVPRDWIKECLLAGKSVQACIAGVLYGDINIMSMVSKQQNELVRHQVRLIPPKEVVVNSQKTSRPFHDDEHYTRLLIDVKNYVKQSKTGRNSSGDKSLEDKYEEIMKSTEARNKYIEFCRGSADHIKTKIDEIYMEQSKTAVGVLITLYADIIQKNELKKNEERLKMIETAQTALATLESKQDDNSKKYTIDELKTIISSLH